MSESNLLRAFNKIEETLQAENHFVENGDSLKRSEENTKKRKSGHKFTLQDHIEWMVFAQLSNNRPWDPIAEHYTEIKENIFKNFDAETLKNTDWNEFCNALCAISCGNRQIKNQMMNLKHNIEVLESIEHENVMGIDEYFTKYCKEHSAWELACKLSDPKSKYKLKYIGTALACEYLRNAGFDIIKPDTHVCRILGYLGVGKNSPNEATADESYRACKEIAAQKDCSLRYVDAVLWQFCAEKGSDEDSEGAEICAKDKPQCKKCLAKEYCRHV